MSYLFVHTKIFSMVRDNYVPTRILNFIIFSHISKLNYRFSISQRHPCVGGKTLKLDELTRKAF